MALVQITGCQYSQENLIMRILEIDLKGSGLNLKMGN